MFLSSHLLLIETCIVCVFLENSSVWFNNISTAFKSSITSKTFIVFHAQMNLDLLYLQDTEKYQNLYQVARKYGLVCLAFQNTH